MLLKTLFFILFEIIPIENLEALLALAFGLYSSRRAPLHPPFPSLLLLAKAEETSKAASSLPCSCEAARQISRRGKALSLPNLCQGRNSTLPLAKQPRLATPSHGEARRGEARLCPPPRQRVGLAVRWVGVGLAGVGRGWVK